MQRHQICENATPLQILYCLYKAQICMAGQLWSEKIWQGGPDAKSCPQLILPNSVYRPVFLRRAAYFSVLEASSRTERNSRFSRFADKGRQCCGQVPSHFHENLLTGMIGLWACPSTTDYVAMADEGRPNAVNAGCLFGFQFWAWGTLGRSNIVPLSGELASGPCQRSVRVSYLLFFRESLRVLL